MGFILESTPEMGPFNIEVRSESVLLTCEDDDSVPYVYPDTYRFPGTERGSVEFLIEDLPRLRAALEIAEKHVREKRGGFLNG